MDELEVTPMSDERVIKALRELRTYWLGKSPSKYFFAISRAIRNLEEVNNGSKR